MPVMLFTIHNLFRHIYSLVANVVETLRQCSREFSVFYRLKNFLRIINSKCIKFPLQRVFFNIGSNPESGIAVKGHKYIAFWIGQFKCRKIIIRGLGARLTFQCVIKSASILASCLYQSIS